MWAMRDEFYETEAMESNPWRNGCDSVEEAGAVKIS